MILIEIVSLYILLLMSRVYRSNLGQSGFGGNTVFGEQLVHCPVCNLSYASEQVEAHIQRHNLFSSKIHQTPIDIPTQPSSRSLFTYPMIEPLQFQVSGFVQSNKKQIIIIEQKQRNKIQPKVIEMIDRQTQTINRPFLQSQSEERDLFNILDGLFNNGKLSYEQDVGNNVGLASKRNLTEWQSNRLQK